MQRVELGLGNGVLFSNQYRDVLIELRFSYSACDTLCMYICSLFQLCSLLVQVCAICFLVVHDVSWPSLCNALPTKLLYYSNYHSLSCNVCMCQLLTLGAHARGLLYLSCVCVYPSVCLFPL